MPNVKNIGYGTLMVLMIVAMSKLNVDLDLPRIEINFAFDGPTERVVDDGKMVILQTLGCDGNLQTVSRRVKGEECQNVVDNMTTTYTQDGEHHIIFFSKELTTFDGVPVNFKQSKEDMVYSKNVKDIVEKEKNVITEDRIEMVGNAVKIQVSTELGFTFYFSKEAGEIPGFRRNLKFDDGRGSGGGGGVTSCWGIDNQGPTHAQYQAHQQSQGSSSPGQAAAASGRRDLGGCASGTLQQSAYNGNTFCRRGIGWQAPLLGECHLRGRTGTWQTGYTLQWLHHDDVCGVYSGWYRGSSTETRLRRHNGCQGGWRSLSITARVGNVRTGECWCNCHDMCSAISANVVAEIAIAAILFALGLMGFSLGGFLASRIFTGRGVINSLASAVWEWMFDNTVGRGFGLTQLFGSLTGLNRLFAAVEMNNLHCSHRICDDFSKEYGSVRGGKITTYWSTNNGPNAP